MPNHSVERTARGTVASITGTCGSDECPVETTVDDGGIEYRCPVTDDVLATVNPVEDAAEEPGETRPKTIDELQNERRRRRRRRRRRNR